MHLAVPGMDFTFRREGNHFERRHVNLPMTPQSPLDRPAVPQSKTGTRRRTDRSYSASRCRRLAYSSGVGKAFAKPGGRRYWAVQHPNGFGSPSRSWVQPRPRPICLRLTPAP
jgi:hypothetical protein